MARNIGAVLAGILIGFATVWIVETIGHIFYPISSDVSLDNPERVDAFVMAMPVGAQAFVIAAWFLGALAGGTVAVRISGARWAAWLIGSLVALAAIFTIFTIPHPELLQIAAVVAPLAAALVAAHFTGRRVAGLAEAEDIPADA